MIQTWVSLTLKSAAPLRHKRESPPVRTGFPEDTKPYQPAKSPS